MLELRAIFRKGRPVIRLDNVSKRHGNKILFLDSSMTLYPGEKIGLVGPNGAGKSTVFRMVIKSETPDAGQVVTDRGTTIGYFDQDVGEMQGRSVLEETLSGAGEVSDVGAELKRLEIAMGDPEQMDQLDELIEKFGEIQARFTDLDGYSLEPRAQEILAGLGFASEVVDQDVGKLSGGWKMRVALAKILLMKPDVLLLDEPTNHLDIESIIWLESFLKSFDGALMMTSHDRKFMNRIVTKIVDIDAGELISYSGDYEFYLEQRSLRLAQQEAQFARQQAMLAKEEAFIERFKARASHAAQVQSRVKKLDKIDKIEAPRVRKTIEFEFRVPPRSGDDVMKITNLSKAYGSKAVYNNFSFLIRRRERWCIMGINGAGKSTLLKMMAGDSTPDSGEVQVGAAVKMGYFSQHSMEILDPSKTVFEMLETSFPMASVGSLRALAGAFGFAGSDADKHCSVLSGGEKARVVLALMLFDPPNFLVLDEPTNHLDLETKEILKNAMASFEGTMIFVSHDRDFLSAISNRVLELGIDGPVLYGGGYDEYVAQSGQEAPGLRN